MCVGTTSSLSQCTTVITRSLRQKTTNFSTHRFIRSSFHMKHTHTLTHTNVIRTINIVHDYMFGLRTLKNKNQPLLCIRLCSYESCPSFLFQHLKTNRTRHSGRFGLSALLISTHSNEKKNGFIHKSHPVMCIYQLCSHVRHCIIL